jgi:hypothetical protein
MPVRTDYILRLLQQLAQLLARVMGLRRSGKHEDAIALLDEGCTQIFGFDTRVAVAIGTADLLALLKDKYGSTLRSSLVLAELLASVGATRVEQGSSEGGALVFRRALSLVLAAVQSSEASADDVDAASRLTDELRRSIGDSRIPIDELAIAARLHERAGAFASAEDAHFVLVRRASSNARAETRAFYERLLARPEDELERGGLPREEVQEGLRALAATMERP